MTGSTHYSDVFDCPPTMDYESYMEDKGINIPTKKRSAPDMPTKQEAAQKLEAARRAMHRAQTAVIEAEAEFYRTPTPPPEPDIGSMLGFHKQFSPGGKTYAYAAIRADNGLWYTTGPRSPKGYAWENFLGWVNAGVAPTLWVMRSEGWVGEDEEF